MSVFKQYKTNSVKETEGVVVEVAVNEDGTTASVVLSRMGKSNKAYSKALDRETKPHRRAIELGTMNEDIANKIFKKVFATTVLKGWSNMQNEDGVDIPYSEENAIELMTALPDLYEELQSKANSAALFRDDALEAEAKN